MIPFRINMEEDFKQNGMATDNSNQDLARKLILLIESIITSDWCGICDATHVNQVANFFILFIFFADHNRLDAPFFISKEANKERKCMTVWQNKGNTSDSKQLASPPSLPMRSAMPNELALTGRIINSGMAR